jgi:hypothetical protein
MPHLKGVGATSACLREAASAKAGRPLEREAKASPTQSLLIPPSKIDSGRNSLDSLSFE